MDFNDLDAAMEAVEAELSHEADSDEDAKELTRGGADVTAAGNQVQVQVQVQQDSEKVLTFYMLSGEPITVSLRKIFGASSSSYDGRSDNTANRNAEQGQGPRRTVEVEALSYQPPGWQLSNEVVFQRLQHELAEGIRAAARKNAGQEDADGKSKVNNSVNEENDDQLVVDEDQVRILKNGIEVTAYDDLVDGLREGQVPDPFLLGDGAPFLQVMVNYHRYVPGPEEYARIQEANATAGEVMAPGGDYLHYDGFIRRYR